MTRPKIENACPDCGHVHVDETLGGICIGCPCETRPTPEAKTDFEVVGPLSIEIDPSEFYGHEGCDDAYNTLRDEIRRWHDAEHSGAARFCEHDVCKAAEL